MTWDDVLASTRPGQEVNIGPDRWLVLRRSWQPSNVHAGVTDAARLVVEVVLAGSPQDPRHQYDDLADGGVPS